MVVYLNKAAEKHAEYRALHKELLLHHQRVQAGWFADDPVYATVRRIELKSRIDVLQRTYGADW